MNRETPAARALVGCLALAEGATLNEALKLAGYSVKSAWPVAFYRGRCYHRGPAVIGAGSGCRVVVRRGRVVRVSLNAHELTRWMLRLGRKLAFEAERHGRRAA